MVSERYIRHRLINAVTSEKADLELYDTLGGVDETVEVFVVWR
jgi:hypothetical protein